MTQTDPNVNLLERYFKLRRENPHLISFFFDEHSEAAELIGAISEMIDGREIHKANTPKPKPVSSGDLERKSRIYNLMMINGLHEKAERYLAKHPGLKGYISKQSEARPAVGVVPVRDSNKTLADLLGRNISKHSAGLIIKNPDFRHEDIDTVTESYLYSLLQDVPETAAAFLSSIQPYWKDRNIRKLVTTFHTISASRENPVLELDVEQEKRKKYLPVIQYVKRESSKMNDLVHAIMALQDYDCSFE